jgi:hypothetical protein
MNKISVAIAILTVISYEAVRVSGEYNFWVKRHRQEHSYFELFISNWNVNYLVVYSLIVFSTSVAVFLNKNKPTVQKTWNLVCLALLVWLIYCVPGASESRYTSTCMGFTIFYCVVMPVPALVLIVLGACAKNAQKPTE